MKIIQIITQREAAGAQTRAVNMMQELNRRGHRVTTVFLYSKRAAFAEHASLIDLWPRRPAIYELPLVFLKLWKLLRRERPDIVMPYTHWANVLAAPIARLAGIRSVLANQTTLPSQEPSIARKLDLLWAYLNVYRFVVCNSRTTERELRCRSPVSSVYRLRTVRLGVSMPKSELSKEQIREKYGLPATIPLLIHVGRLSKAKNHESLLRALVTVPDAQLICVGDGEERHNLRALANQLDVSRRVTWMGERRQAEVSELLQAADIFVFPSRWEGFGLAPIEAASVGLPLIVSNISTFHEVLRIESGSEKGSLAGIMVDPESPAKLSSAINSVLSNQEEIQKLGSKSRLLARQYSLQRMVDDYEEIFLQALRK